MMNVQVFGKPLEKLVDTVSKGIGIKYKPKAIRDEADAEAYKITIIAEAKAKASIIKADADSEIADRARQRLYAQEMTRQKNLENIIEKSEEHLAKEVSDVPISEDWRTRFFNKAQDITSEELQDIWGKILANELNKPGTLSVRSLDVLSNLSKEEAEILKKIAGISSEAGSIYKINGNSLDEFGIRYYDLLILKSAGLLFESDTLIANYQPNNIYKMFKPNAIVIPISGKLRIVYSFDGGPVSMEQFCLTPSGREIIGVIEHERNEDYYNKLVEHYKSKNIIIQDQETFLLEVVNELIKKSED